MAKKKTRELPEGVIRGEDGVARCFWAKGDPIMAAYHDREWGLPVTEDRRLFEKMCLESFQSGLSWRVILHKRENFRKAFANFEIEEVARFRPSKIEALMKDTGIVRNRRKIEATLGNAKAARALIREEGSLAAYVWRFVPDRASLPAKMTKAALVARTTSAESKAMAKDLKRRGFAFLGPTTLYSFMQAMGLVNDHLEGCAARPRVAEAQEAKNRPPPDGQPTDIDDNPLEVDQRSEGSKDQA